MGYSLGVDLGTTFVAAALAVDGRAEMFTLGDRSEVTPSAVYLREDNTLVTGDAAANPRTTSSTDRVAREFKRRLGDPTPVVLGGRSYAATELLGAQLRDVLDRVTRSEGGEPENVVLTHPANWGPFRRTLFDGVLHFGGLATALKVTEPEAAAARYADTRALDDGQMVAVYDLGGGTFDATILRKIPGGMEIVGIPEGIERLGGIDFDEAILRYVNYTSDNALNDLDMRDHKTTVALARLRQDCVLAKEALSADTETVLPVFLPDRHFDVRLDRKTFEDLIRAQVESTIGALSRTLDSAQVNPEELHAVLLIGGSSRIPLVAKMLTESLGRPIAIDTHPKYAVALGAATLADKAHGTPAVSAPHTTTPAAAGATSGKPAAPPSAPTSAPKPPSPPSAPTPPASTPPSAPSAPSAAMPMPAPPSAPAAMPAAPAPAAPQSFASRPAAPQQPPAPAQPQRPGGQQGYPQGPQPGYQGHPQQGHPHYNPGTYPGYPQQGYQGYPQQGRPGYPQPGYQQGRPANAQPGNGQPGNGQPGNAQPPHQGQPGYGQPTYQGQPHQQPGQQGQTGHGPQGQTAQQAVYGQQSRTGQQPAYAQQAPPPQQGPPPQQAQPAQQDYTQHPYGVPGQAYALPPGAAPTKKSSTVKKVLVSFIIVAVLVMAGTAAYLVLKPDLSRFGIGAPQSATAAGGAATEVTPSDLGVQPRLVATTDEIKPGGTYSVTASGFSPGEIVQVTWNGPTAGTMGTQPGHIGARELTSEI